jgi:para-nitrobenzyl esterase
MAERRLCPDSERALGSRILDVAAEPVEPQRVLDAYRRSAEPGAGDLAGLASAIESDAHFRLPAIRFAQAQARHETRTFMYRFDWASPLLGGALGACHGLEVPFVFGRTGAPGIASLVGDGEAARALSERMMDAWVAFARSGDPSCASLGPWPAYDAARRTTMLLGPECRVAHDPGGIERRAWLPAPRRLVAEPGRIGRRACPVDAEPG